MLTADQILTKIRDSRHKLATPANQFAVEFAVREVCRQRDEALAAIQVALDSDGVSFQDEVLLHTFLNIAAGTAA
ncbi:hypothetical protein [Nevskia ramosa]|uniref:hypothetical protein n=1 Tax=Nevskia ramosa TaxID=64002 RepID=UPI003D0CB19F